MNDRLPPHSTEAEQGVLGCILLDPNANLDNCVGYFPTPEVFYDLKHRTIYEALVDMHDNRDAIDTITLQQLLKDRKQLEQVGGLAFLSSLPDGVPNAANLGYYAATVRSKWLLRRVLQECCAISAAIYEHEGDNVQECLDDVERRILAINENRQTEDAKDIGKLVDSAIETLEQYHGAQGRCIGVTTGYPDLDDLTNGMKPGEVWVIAGRPSTGKTSIGMNIVEHATIDCGLSVGVFSLEMTAESLALRMLCSRARVNLQEAHKGRLLERDFPSLTMAAGKLAKTKLFIDDISGLTVLQLRARARRMQRKHGIKLLVIDYLQLLRGRRAENRNQEVAEISNGIKSLAKELRVPIILLSQLNRELEKDKHRKPRLSDLRESGSIEQDADLVGMLYRPEEEKEGQVAVNVNLLIAKQRNGPTGEVRLVFLKSFTRFESASKNCEP